MQKTRFVSGWGVFIALALLSFGCGSGDSRSSSSVISTPKTFSSLVFTTSSPHGSYARGATIPITFTVANKGTQQANLQFTSCNDLVVIISKGGQQMWIGPSGDCFHVLRSVVIAPGATKTYTLTWDQIDPKGLAAPSGTYSVDARLTPSTLNGNDALAPGLEANFTSNPLAVSIGP